MNYKKRLAAALIVLAVIFAGGAAMFRFWPRVSRWEIPEGEKPVSNPLKGWAAWSESFRPGYSLAYVPVYWSELEPEKGAFDFDFLEEKYHFQQWRDSRTRLILRVVADSPSEEGGMQIPRWLYEGMDGDGTWYDSEYGRGFSPNYENPVLRAAHGEFLDALGGRYGKDSQICYIQLGSLGHWGEWHVNREAGIRTFPDSTVTDGYVKDYLAAFPEKKLLMRRPYALVSEEGIGLYDDTFGEERQHREWMDWIENGYVSSQNGQELPGAPGFWKTAPSGGEIASYHDIGWYFEENFENTLRFIGESHTTYLGPHVPRAGELSAQAWANAEACQREMGYCFTIRRASLTRRKGHDMRLGILWENIGVAPFYEDWDVRVELRDSRGAALWSGDFPTEMSAWGETEKFQAVLEGTDGLEDACSVWAGIVDPMTGSCGVKLAADVENARNMYCLGEI